MFKGVFFYCDGPDIVYQNITNKVECLHYPQNRWLNQKYNFDNLAQALMCLFVLSSKDGWVEIMYHGLDAVGVDQQVTWACLVNYLNIVFSLSKTIMSSGYCTLSPSSSLLASLFSTCLWGLWWRTSTGAGRSRTGRREL